MEIEQEGIQTEVGIPHRLFRKKVDRVLGSFDNHLATALRQFLQKSEMNVSHWVFQKSTAQWFSISMQ